MEENGLYLDRNKGDIQNLDGFLFAEKTQEISQENSAKSDKHGSILAAGQGHDKNDHSNDENEDEEEYDELDSKSIKDLHSFAQKKQYLSVDSKDQRSTQFLQASLSNGSKARYELQEIIEGIPYPDNLSMTSVSNSNHSYLGSTPQRNNPSSSSNNHTASSQRTSSNRFSQEMANLHFNNNNNQMPFSLQQSIQNLQFLQDQHFQMQNSKQISRKRNETDSSSSGGGFLQEQALGWSKSNLQGNPNSVFPEVLAPSIELSNENGSVFNVGSGYSAITNPLLQEKQILNLNQGIQFQEQMLLPSKLNVATFGASDVADYSDNEEEEEFHAKGQQFYQQQQNIQKQRINQIKQREVMQNGQQQFYDPNLISRQFQQAEEYGKLRDINQVLYNEENNENEEEQQFYQQNNISHQNEESYISDDGDHHESQQQQQQQQQILSISQQKVNFEDQQNSLQRLSQLSRNNNNSSVQKIILQNDSRSSGIHGTNKNSGIQDGNNNSNFNKNQDKSGLENKSRASGFQDKSRISGFQERSQNYVKNENYLDEGGNNQNENVLQCNSEKSHSRIFSAYGEKSQISPRELQQQKIKNADYLEKGNISNSNTSNNGHVSIPSFEQNHFLGEQLAREIKEKNILGLQLQEALAQASHLEQEKNYFAEQAEEIHSHLIFIQEKYSDSGSIERLRGRELESERAARMQMRIQVEQKNLKINQILSEMTKLEQERSGLAEELARSQEVQRIESEVLEECQEEIRRLQDDNMDLQLQLRDVKLKQQQGNDDKKQIDMLKTTRDELKRRINDLERDTHGLREQLQYQRESAISYQLQISDSKDKQFHLKQDFVMDKIHLAFGEMFDQPTIWSGNNLDETIDALSKVVSERFKATRNELEEMKRIKDENKSLHGQIQYLESISKSSQNIIQQLEDRIKNKQDKLLSEEKKTKHKNSADSEVFNRSNLKRDENEGDAIVQKQLENDLRNVETMLASEQQEKALLKAEVEHLVEQVEKEEKDKSKFKERVERQEKDIIAKEKEIQQKERENRMLLDNINRLKTSYERMQSELQAHLTQLKQETNTSHRLSLTNQHLTEDNKQLLTHISSLQAQVSKAINENNLNRQHTKAKSCQYSVHVGSRHPFLSQLQSHGPLGNRRNSFPNLQPFLDDSSEQNFSPFKVQHHPDNQNFDQLEEQFLDNNQNPLRTEGPVDEQIVQIEQDEKTYPTTHTHGSQSNLSLESFYHNNASNHNNNSHLPSSSSRGKNNNKSKKQDISRPAEQLLISKNHQDISQNIQQSKAETVPLAQYLQIFKKNLQDSQRFSLPQSAFPVLNINTNSNKFGHNIHCSQQLLSENDDAQDAQQPSQLEERQEELHEQFENQENNSCDCCQKLTEELQSNEQKFVNMRTQIDNYEREFMQMKTQCLIRVSSLQKTLEDLEAENQFLAKQNQEQTLATAASTPSGSSQVFLAPEMLSSEETIDLLEEILRKAFRSNEMKNDILKSRELCFLLSGFNASKVDYSSKQSASLINSTNQLLSSQKLLSSPHENRYNQLSPQIFLSSCSDSHFRQSPTAQQWIGKSIQQELSNRSESVCIKPRNFASNFKNQLSPTNVPQNYEQEKAALAASALDQHYLRHIQNQEQFLENNPFFNEEALLEKQKNQEQQWHPNFNQIQINGFATSNSPLNPSVFVPPSNRRPKNCQFISLH